MLDLVATFLIGLVASILSGMSGGGAGIITIPFFLFIGLPPHAAVATTKFGAVGIAIGSVSKFFKTEHIQWKYVVYLSFFSVCASLIGAQLLLAIAEETVEKIIGMLILVVLPLLFTKKFGLTNATTSALKKGVGYAVYFITMILQSAFGSGIGMVVVLIMSWFFGLSLLAATATKRIPGVLMSLTALIVFAWHGVIFWSYGIAVFLGMLIGSYLGTHLAIRKGNQFVKIILAIVLLIMGLKLLLA